MRKVCILFFVSASNNVMKIFRTVFAFGFLAALAFAQTNNARMLSGVNYQTGTTYTFVALDATRIVNFANASPIAASLPSGVNLGFGAGIEFAVVNKGTGTVTITCSSCTINGVGALALSSAQSAELFSDGVNYVAALGAGTSGGGNVPTGVAVGSHLISTGVSLPPAYQVIPYPDPRNYGVDCTGVLDSTSAAQTFVNTAFSSAPNAGKIILPHPCAISISSQITFSSMYGIHFDGGGSQGQAPLDVGFVWHGASNGSPILVNKTRDAVFENFYVYCPTGCNNGITLDEVGGGGGIITNDELNNISIFNNVQNSSFHGINVCPNAPGNCEDLRLNAINVVCPGPTPTANNNGTAILFMGGVSAQPFGSSITDPEIAGCSRGIDVEGVNVLKISGGLFESNYTDVYCGSGRGVFWGFTRSEQSLNQVQLDNNCIDFTTDHVSFGGLTGGTTTYNYIQSTGGTRLKISNNDWDNTAVTPVAGPSGGNSAALESENNNYPNGTTCPNWGLFGHGTESIQDNCTDSQGLYSLLVGNRELELVGKASPGAGISVRSPALVLQGSNFGIGADGSSITHVPFGNNLSSYLAISHPYTTSFFMSPPAFVGGTSVSQVATPTLFSVTATGTPGSTSYTYKIVATDGVGGTTPASAAGTNASGNATLSGNNCNRLNWFENSGAYKYLVYRTASGGTPSSTGLVATVWPSQETPTGYLLFDCGLTGDSSSPPSTNTTGQIISALPTGLPPLVLASTTPVANLTVSNHPTLQDCGTTSTCANTQKTAALIVRGSVAFPTASTVTVTSLPFTNSTSYSCTAGDATTAAGVINATTYTSGSSVTFTETNGVNTDTIRYLCAGF